MPGEVEPRMNFIIERQAQFAADIQVLKERQAETARQLEANSGMIRQLIDVSMSLARHGEETDRRLARLGEETDRRIRELRVAQVHSDHRPDALIDTVDKLVRRNAS